VLFEAELHALTVTWETPHDNGAAITNFGLRQCWDNVDHEFKRTVQKVSERNERAFWKTRAMDLAKWLQTYGYIHY